MTTELRSLQSPAADIIADPAYIKRMKPLSYFEKESWDTWIAILEEANKIHRAPREEKEEPEYIVGAQGVCPQCFTELPNSGVCGVCEG